MTTKRLLLIPVLLLFAMGILSPAIAAPSYNNPGTTNLVAWWSLDETGGVRNDSHGANHLTDNNTVTSVTGKHGNAADFVSAQSEYLSVADNVSLSAGNVDYTICGWIYLKNKSDNHRFASKWTAGTNNRSWQLSYSTILDTFSFQISSNGTDVVSIWATNFGSPSISTWYFICAWHDATADTINIQVNNGKTNSAAHSAGMYDDNGAFLIGASFVSPSTVYTDMYIDEVLIAKRIYTADERSWLYNDGAGRSYSNLIPTATPTNTFTPTNTATFTPTFTPTNTATHTPTDTPTITPTVPTSTPATHAWTLVPEITYGDYAVTLSFAGLCLVVILIALTALGLYVGQRKGKR